MGDQTEFDRGAAHKFFAADCFNKAWDLIDKEGRSKEQDQEMIRLNQASIWHWTQRDDCTDKNMSVGYWQASRIYALLGQVENARRYGELSLEYAKDEAPFYRAYGHEALARAEHVGGEDQKAKDHLDAARDLVDQIEDAESKQLLRDDLATIG